MNKEKQIQKYKSKQLIDELSKMPPIVIATAYFHTINYTLYGEKAYRIGYYDALQRQAESEGKHIRRKDEE